MKKFDLIQINKLLTGNALSIEIKSTSKKRRAFIKIKAYVPNGKMSKFLNADKSNVRFLFRKYEIETKYIENDLDVSEEELYDAIFINNIQSLNELEKEVSKYIDDFSNFDNEWKFDNPL
ncbi:hypothetical protein SAMN05444392_12420 [Seinonella peptonophila]|uniref:Uncharacterized protein n=1 Tax=Seinonella peptonophila TaxID=112248 RepID=A0A1M5BIE8_9BACL|nr:hypothetical protein [Seinonella peptonophila]SHF42271.1 hypothetical protein SAMN05444392_12420 [Seinonella peptonophila]